MSFLSQPFINLESTVAVIEIGSISLHHRRSFLIWISCKILKQNERDQRFISGSYFYNAIFNTRHKLVWKIFWYTRKRRPEQLWQNATIEIQITRVNLGSHIRTIRQSFISKFDKLGHDFMHVQFIIWPDI